MLWRADRGCTDFISDLFLYLFLGILFWGGQDNTALSWIWNDVLILWWGTAWDPLSNTNSIHATWYSGKPSGILTLQLGQQECLPEVCASPEELPNTGSWASMCPAASATSVWCSSVSISEFNGEFQLLPVPAMDLPLSLLLQLGCF